MPHHEHHTEPEGEAIGEAGPHRGRLVAVATVVTTLAAAATGLLQATAVKTHDESAVRAERLAAVAVNVAAGNSDQADVQIDRYRTWQDERAHARAAGRSSRSARLDEVRWANAAATTARHTAAIARHQAIKTRCSAESGTCATRPLAPLCARPGACGDEDAVKAEEVRYRERGQRETYRLSALREAENQRADGAEGRFAHLAAALIMFAVAVFLFGYSLTPQGADRRGLFTLVASCFFAAGLVWALLHAFTGDDAPPARAASAFADGEMMLRVAQQAPYVGPSAVKVNRDLEAARGDLARAVKLAPHSVEAYEELASAQYALEDPEGTGNSASVRALRDIVRDQQAAIDHGSESPTARFELGASELVLGLKADDDGLVARARDLSSESAARFVEQQKDQRAPGKYLVFARFTVGEAELALGDPAARKDYCRAIAAMRAMPPEVDTSIQQIVLLARDDLRLIARERPQRARAAQARLVDVEAAANGLPPRGCTAS
jgi:hypothetical protein